MCLQKMGYIVLILYEVNAANIRSRNDIFTLSLVK